MKLAVVGATGLIGRKMLQVIEEQDVHIDELIVAASKRSVGREIPFKGNDYKLIAVEDAIAAKPDIAIFSAGADASKQYAPLFAKNGTYVIDNSSAWRKNPEIPLVVPEINADDIENQHHIIANPNCSTIELVLALAPLHRKYNIKRLVVSTYQSVSGSGLKGLNQLHCEQNGKMSENPAYPHPIHENIIPHGGDFLDNQYTTEEEKLIFETNKILHSNIKITATVARVPVFGGHSESANIEFEKPFDLQTVVSDLAAFPGIKVVDNPAKNEYPTPLRLTTKTMYSSAVSAAISASTTA